MILATFTSIVLASSAVISGYPAPTTGPTSKIEGRIIRLVESPEAYMLRIGSHSAFYKFPKSNDLQKKHLNTLQKYLKDKKNLSLKVNPLNAEIIAIEL